MDTKIKVSLIKNDPIFNNLELPILVPDLRLQNVHSVVKNILQGLKVHQVPLTGRLSHFQKAWEKLTKKIRTFCLS